MIDLHSHVLHGIDDGSRDIEESLEMLRVAKELGFTGIVCTPHYKAGRAENESYSEKFQELKERIKKENIEMELYPGNEMFLGMEEITALKMGKVNTYNSDGINSKVDLDSHNLRVDNLKVEGGVRYLLIELNPIMPFPPAKMALERIVEMGYTPILAHIERYMEVRIPDFLKLREMGVLFQINLPSLGNRHRERTLKFLELGLASFFTSDAHRIDKRTYELKNELQELREVVGEERFQKMCEDSFKVVRGEKVEPIPMKVPEKKTEEKIEEILEEKKGRFLSRLMKKILKKS